MIFDFTDRNYRTDCIDGCGSLTDWMTSRRAADQVSKNHEKSISHRCIVKERTKQLDEFLAEPHFRGGHMSPIVQPGH